MSRFVRYSSLFALLLPSATGCVSQLTTTAGLFRADRTVPPVVRVRLPDPGSELIVSTTDRMLIRIPEQPTGAILTYSTHASVQLTIHNGGIDVISADGARLGLDLNGLTIQTVNDDGVLTVNGIAHSGCLIVGRDNAEIQVVNRLNLDDYLTGVLQPELGERRDDEIEAVKAQAVAARTYALAHLGQYESKSYDLHADVSDQVYLGRSQRRDWVDRAVSATAGEVIRSDGHLIDAFYHSTCGGSTDAIEDIWGSSPRPYLQRVVDDTFCLWSKYTVWTEEFDEPTLTGNLRSYRRLLRDAPIADFDRITDIRLDGRTAGGRYRRLTVETPSGIWTILDDKIRWALGRPSRPGTILPSSNFTLELTRDADGRVVGAVVHGAGYGHGVGMCQCGMIGRARDGERYDIILTTYYPGTEVVRVY